MHSMVKAQSSVLYQCEMQSRNKLQKNELRPLNMAPLPYVGDGGWKEILPIIQTHYTNHILSCGSRVLMYHNHHHLQASSGQ